jgi:hypothetical protein
MGGKGGRCVGLTTLPPSCADCLKIWKPQTPGTLKACNGIALPLLLHHNRLQSPEGGYMYSSTLSSFRHLSRRWMVNITSRPLYPRERPGTHFTGGWVGPRAGLDVSEKSRPYQDSIHGPSSP